MQTYQIEFTEEEMLLFYSGLLSLKHDMECMTLAPADTKTRRCVIEYRNNVIERINQLKDKMKTNGIVY